MADAEQHAPGGCVSRAELSQLLADQRAQLTADFERRLAVSNPPATPASAEHDAPDAPRSRRWLLTTGAAAAGVAALIGEASPAVASGTMLYGTSNSAAGSSTSLDSTAGSQTLNVTNSGTGTALVADSNTFFDLSLNGTGRFYQFPVHASPPSGSLFYLGETVRSLDGQQWICVGNGNPGTWQKVAAAAPGARGGSQNMLVNPFRLYDSRDNSGSFNTTGKLGDGGSKTFQVTGTAPRGGVIADGVPGSPAKAIGIVGTITATQTTAGGHLQMYPNTLPITANLTWTGANQTVSTGYIVGLSTAGTVTVRVHTSAHIVFDITGYVY